MWAGFLSLVLPGLGQIYAGAFWLGVLLYVVAYGLPLAFIALTGWVAPTPNAIAALLLVAFVFVVVRLAIAMDAARRVRRGQTRSVAPWYRSTWFAAIIMLGIEVVLDFGIIPGPKAGWRSFSTPSASNLPTLIPGDAFVADIRHPGVMPAYGDVAIFHITRDPRTDYVKRVVGLPGDLVQLRQGVLYLNGQPVRREAAGDWKYATGPGAATADVFKRYRETLPNGRTYDIVLISDDAPAENTAEFKVPPDSFFALGDNRDNSLDSRQLQNFGYVPKANVVGIANTVFWSHDMSRLLSRVE